VCARRSRTGWSTAISAVEASAARLEQRMIVEREGESLRAMTVGESLAKCQINSSESSLLIIENGVIRVRKEDG
jgi:hypothetical protein